MATYCALAMIYLRVGYNVAMVELLIVKTIKCIDIFTENIGKIISWCTFLVVLITCLVVMLRYVFLVGSVALQESVIYLNAIVFMLGAAFTYKHDGHVRVDIFYSKYSVKAKAWVNLLGCLLLLLPMSIFIFCASIDYVILSWEMREKSVEAGGLPFVYVLKLLILCMSTLLVLQGFAEAFRAIRTLLNKKSPTKNPP